MDKQLPHKTHPIPPKLRALYYAVLTEKEKNARIAKKLEQEKESLALDDKKKEIKDLAQSEDMALREKRLAFLLETFEKEKKLHNQIIDLQEMEQDIAYKDQLHDLKQEKLDADRLLFDAQQQHGHLALDKKAFTIETDSRLLEIEKGLHTIQKKQDNLDNTIERFQIEQAKGELEDNRRKFLIEGEQERVKMMLEQFNVLQERFAVKQQQFGLDQTKGELELLQGQITNQQNRNELENDRRAYLLEQERTTIGNDRTQLHLEKDRHELEVMVQEFHLLQERFALDTKDEKLKLDKREAEISLDKKLLLILLQEIDSKIKLLKEENTLIVNNDERVQELLKELRHKLKEVKLRGLQLDVKKRQVEVLDRERGIKYKAMQEASKQESRDASRMKRLATEQMRLARQYKQVVVNREQAFNKYLKDFS
jgi:hypothetical protein